MKKHTEQQLWTNENQLQDRTCKNLSENLAHRILQPPNNASQLDMLNIIIILKKKQQIRAKQLYTLLEYNTKNQAPHPNPPKKI